MTSKTEIAPAFISPTQTPPLALDDAVSLPKPITCGECKQQQQPFPMTTTFKIEYSSVCESCFVNKKIPGVCSACKASVTVNKFYTPELAERPILCLACVDARQRVHDAVLDHYALNSETCFELARSKLRVRGSLFQPTDKYVDEIVHHIAGMTNPSLDAVVALLEGVIRGRIGRRNRQIGIGGRRLMFSPSQADAVYDVVLKVCSKRNLEGKREAVYHLLAPYCMVPHVLKQNGIGPMCSLHYAFDRTASQRVVGSLDELLKRLVELWNSKWSFCLTNTPIGDICQICRQKFVLNGSEFVAAHDASRCPSCQTAFHTDCVSKQGPDAVCTNCKGKSLQEFERCIPGQSIAPPYNAWHRQGRPVGDAAPSDEKVDEPSPRSGAKRKAEQMQIPPASRPDPPKRVKQVCVCWMGWVHCRLYH
jgi:hypothetical protein